MEDDATLIQLTHLLSGIMRRIHGKPLDKAGDMRFKYMSPEQCAERSNAGLHPTATRTENTPWKTPPPSTSSNACWSRS